MKPTMKIQGMSLFKQLQLAKKKRLEFLLDLKRKRKIKKFQVRPKIKLYPAFYRVDALYYSFFNKKKYKRVVREGVKLYDAKYIYPDFYYERWGQKFLEFYRFLPNEDRQILELNGYKVIGLPYQHIRKRIYNPPKQTVIKYLKEVGATYYKFYRSVITGANLYKIYPKGNLYYFRGTKPPRAKHILVDKRVGRVPIVCFMRKGTLKGYLVTQEMYDFYKECYHYKLKQKRYQLWILKR